VVIRKRCQRQFVAAFLVVAGLTATGTAAQSTKPSDETAAATLAVRTLADRLRVSPAQVGVSRVSVAEWRDSSLGCPEHGQQYRQQLLAGHIVRLLHEGRHYEVHVAAGRAVMCADAQSPKIPASAIVAPSRKAADMVRTAVAAHLAIGADDVRIDSTRPFKDASASCPTSRAQALGPAYLVEARVGNRTFLYYVDDAGAMSCEAVAR
jgi:hypothetical protein